MKIKKYLLAAISLACLPATAQQVIHVGKGSYASYTPLSLCYSEDHSSGNYGGKGDKSREMQTRKFYLTERENQPIPTNDWWTNLITETYSGRLWSYPQMIQANSAGLDIQQPSFWIADGTEMKSNTFLTVGGEKFKPASAVAEHWHDWDVEFSMNDGSSRQMYVTMAHGMPFTWIETSGINPTLQLQKSGWTDGDYQDTDTHYYDANHHLLAGTVQADQLVMERGGDLYGIYLPKGSTIIIGERQATVIYPQAMDDGYVVVAMLGRMSDLTNFAEYALHVPRNTRVDWHYEATQGKMSTTWHVDAEDLATGKSADKVMQGFIPHQWRDTGYDCTLPFIGKEYKTPHGKLKMAVGNDFKVDYKFYGMLPYWALPSGSDSEKNPYDGQKMLQMLTEYANTGSFGADTYWGGKGLTQMALYMMMAREMGRKELFEQCRRRLKETMVNWLTYTPGESNYFFARYDRWGGLVGYATSYDSDTFNDHHFHYGYFTLAGALLALVDDDFRDNYGQMLRLIAKDYANWQRSDTRYPLFRTFDPWAGHSFAGGMGDGNGNGQESSSEAMQSWGGIYLLGVALGDDEMRDAGIFGWLSEARGTAEYWFDRHRDNIDYTKFKHPYNSNLTCHGVGYWTYFGYQNIYMQGIQWMPTSTALDYLSEDKKFAHWDYEQLFDDPSKTADSDASNGRWFAEGTYANGTLDQAGDWGNVALSYLQRSDPNEAARLFDELWNRDNDIAKKSSTNGITYFSTHSHLTYGDLDWSITASVPTARVYRKSQDEKIHIAYNPTDAPIDVTFSDGFVLSNVPARQLQVEGQTSHAVTDIVREAAPMDVRETLLMPNLALHKPCTASSFENVGTVMENATDGKDDTRWGSAHKDGEWIQVDLQQETSLYKVRIHWETAYASRYTVSLSEDGVHWDYSQDVTSDGGWDDVTLGDHKARYIRVTGKERATAYGISLYELQAFGTPSDATASDIVGIKITADQDVLKQHDTAHLAVKGYTLSGRWTDVKAHFTSTDGIVSDNGDFTPSIYGTAKVNVQLATGKDIYTQSFPVEEALYVRYISVAPKSVLMLSDGTPEPITVTTQDQFKGPLEMNRSHVAYDFYMGTPNEIKNNTGGPVSADVINYDDNSGFLVAHRPGTYTLVAHATENVAIADTISIQTCRFEDMNLAYRKPATASSQKDDNSGPEKAVDGDANGSRWESVWKSDDENITIDLENTYQINKVVVYWENARASEYDLLVSQDGYEWNKVKTVFDSPTGGETIEFAPTSARYVRIQGKHRAMEAYGYSIYEIEVYGLKTPTGIDQPKLQSQDATMIYDVNGRKMGSAKDLKSMPKGIYVVGKKKLTLP